MESSDTDQHARLQYIDNLKSGFYTTVLATDVSRLQQLLALVQTRYGVLEIQTKTWYDVYFQDGYKTEPKSVDELLELDNQAHGRIMILSISLQEWPNPDVVVYPLCWIILDHPDKTNILMNVRGPDMEWTNQVFAEIVDELQRVFPTGLSAM